MVEHKTLCEFLLATKCVDELSHTPYYSTVVNSRECTLLVDDDKTLITVNLYVNNMLEAYLAARQLATGHYFVTGAGLDGFNELEDRVNDFVDIGL